MSMMLGNRGISAEINVTPMIDILLTLIITFLVITPFDSQGEKVVAPHPADPKSAAAAGPDRTIVVQVSDSGSKIPRVQINYEDVPWEQLQARLQDIYKLRAERYCSFAPTATSTGISRPRWWESPTTPASAPSD
jgi:biopolymer transport protein TolR